MAVPVLVVHLVLFVLACIGGFIVAIPTIVTLVDFKGNCILYTTGTWDGAGAKFVSVYGNKGNCLYGVFGSLAVSFFSLVMVIFTFYRLCNRTGTRTFPIFLPLVGNILCFLILFIAACILSVGLKTFCDNVTKDSHIQRCSDAQTWISWENGNVSRFYDMLNVSMLAAWCMVAIYLALSIVAVVRLRRDIQGVGASDKRVLTTEEIA